MKINTRSILLLMLFGIAALTIVSYLHAHRFTHFSTTTKARTDPENLSMGNKILIAFTGIQNPRQQDRIMPEPDYETFFIEGEMKLETWFIPNKENKGLILLYHGYAGNKSQMVSRAEDLYSLGYSTAIIGFRGSGNSEGNYTTIGFEEGQDVITSYAYYREKFPDQPIFLFGSSMGAAAILKAFEMEALPVKGVILEYPFASLYQSVQNRFKVMGFPSFPMAAMLTFFGGWQLDFDAFAHNPSEYARSLSCPVLHLAGDNDDRVNNEETELIFQNLNSKHKTLHIFEGAGHENLNENFREEWLEVCSSFLAEATH